MQPVRREYGYPPRLPQQPQHLGGGQLQNGGVGLGAGGSPVNQHQQQLQHGPGGQGMVGGPQSADGQSNAPVPPPEMNLANVLHYLQSEWRRWERDRNEWEIERAEMRARIALLEGQRRSAENLKVDLLRRVKMLEFALRQERTKATGRPTSGTAALPPSRLAALKDEDNASSSRDDKEGSGSSEGGDDIERPKSNGVHLSKQPSRPIPDTSSWKNLSGPPRDPKARARSREYLKQCLQEITYLTSPGALNPLPPRAPVAVEGGTSSPPNGEAATGVDRPRKNLPEQPIPSPYAQPSAEAAPAPEDSQATSASAPPAALAAAAATATTAAAAATFAAGAAVATSPPNGTDEPKPIAPAQEETPAPPAPSADTSADAPPSSPAPRTLPLPDGAEPPSVDRAAGLTQEPKQTLTAIYKPASKAAWREELRAANEAASKVPWPPRRSSDEESLASITLIEEEVKAEEAEGDSDRIWTTRRALKSHLDIVRSVALANGPELALATVGDDCTVKVWSLDAPSIMSSSLRPLAAELEPVATYRGHSGPVTAVTISSSLGVIFSASADCTIRLWKLPARDHDPYAPYDPSTSIQTLEGHTDIVWDLCLLPPRTEKSSAANGPVKRTAVEKQLISVSADGTAKLWEDRDGKWSLQATFGDFGEGVVPTCLCVDQHDFTRILVGLSNGLVKLFQVDGAEEIQTFGEVGSQVNAILSHPTLPWIITGHEDGHLRFYDTKSSSPNHNLLAHPAPVTALALSPTSPMCILSASVDCSVRLWDLQRKTSLQDLTGHRQRSDEGVTDVASHPDLPIVASAGADGVVRVWGAG
ncbi:1,2-dihydroxy-3-keto-5-methylthiopentene dioxygenase [Vanrija albida]|uniref:1,2-dihydroxy-3-keto-5-methylthiopentene dioxygenase n=1 Tax=Vanrija albida TaxID=181172 RepID=A0ABR3PSF2_9TREE